MKNAKKKKLVPPRYERAWPDGQGQSGVGADASGLRWWNTPGGSGGRFGEMAGDQNYSDFLRYSPPIPGVRTEMVAELEAAVRAGRYQADALSLAPK